MEASDVIVFRSKLTWNQTSILQELVVMIKLSILIKGCYSVCAYNNGNSTRDAVPLKPRMEFNENSICCFPVKF